MLKTVLLFPKAVDSSLPVHSFGYRKDKVKFRGQVQGMNERACSLFFCTYLFIVIYYDSSAETFCETKSRTGHRSQSTSRVLRSSIALTILPQTSPST